VVPRPRGGAPPVAAAAPPPRLVQSSVVQRSLQRRARHVASRLVERRHEPVAVAELLEPAVAELVAPEPPEMAELVPVVESPLSPEPFMVASSESPAENDMQQPPSFKYLQRRRLVGHPPTFHPEGGPAPVPEPCTLAMLSVGAAFSAVAACLRRARPRKQAGASRTLIK
ncbi:MAG: hypothetical protein V2A77_09200, partial [Pseudomonadota bacterium]